MISEEIENIIVKFLSNQCSIIELDSLEEWLEVEENEAVFREYVKINYLIDINTYKFNELAAENIYQNTFKGQTIFLKRAREVLKYAAAVLLLIASSVYLFQNFEGQKTNSYDNEVVLETASGQVKILKNNASSTIKSSEGIVLGKQEGTKVTYDKNLKLEQLVYNTIKVPYGKKFALDLSDGTTVNLNSGTKLKYPVSFLSEGSREVFVLEGEAFFNVAHDTQRPFIVHNEDLKLEVLGTQFNFSAYPEDQDKTTVLIEGAVKLSNGNQKNDIVLSPGFKASLNTNESEFLVVKADVDFHTAWLEGKIIMKNMKFNSIVKKLERHYDVRITNYDELLDEEIITATFEGESIEKVLELIHKINPITYEIDGKNITITESEKKLP